MTVLAILALLMTGGGQPAKTIQLEVDATTTYSISPYIYGANFPDYSKVGNLFTFVRLGGNRTTAYNWETNASNAGSDWHHQNDGYMGESNEAGLTYRKFLEDAQSHQAAVLLTIPTAGYVAADKKGDGDVAQTPNYLEVRFHKSLARKGKPFSYPPSTSDKVVYQDEFVSFLEGKKKSATPLWYSLDNEPDLWGYTHQRIWPKNPTYAQIMANNEEFGRAIKDVAPKSLVFGPANYGFMGFRTFQGAPDSNGRDFIDAYLDHMRQVESKAGKRILDVLDIHWYPEARGDGVRICEGTDKPGTPAARIQAPRSLWDPTYVETSWIADYLGKKPIALLPTINAQIAKHYPGTKLAITEYNYGGGQHVSGAIAQADVLGIFGRYGLFAAANWGISDKDIYQIAAFKAFRDYDRKGSAFGDRGLSVRGENPEIDSLYASLFSNDKSKLTLIYINKESKPHSVAVKTTGFDGKTARAFSITGSHCQKPLQVKASASSGQVRFEAPALSVTTVEVRL